nr:MAG TPA: hypothetical protein [Caudoviricetes sp.]
MVASSASAWNGGSNPSAVFLYNKKIKIRRKII